MGDDAGEGHGGTSISTTAQPAGGSRAQRSEDRSRSAGLKTSHYVRVSKHGDEVLVDGAEVLGPLGGNLLCQTQQR